MTPSTKEIQTAISSARLSHEERHWLYCLLRTQQGTAEAVARAYGLTEADVAEGKSVAKTLSGYASKNLGDICHKLADELGWTQANGDKPEGYRRWIQLAVAFEDTQVRQAEDSLHWVLRPNWVGVTV